jgi:hypothetical protein
MSLKSTSIASLTTRLVYPSWLAIAETQHHRNKKTKRETVQHNHNYATRSRATAAGPYSTGGTVAAGGVSTFRTSRFGLQDFPILTTQGTHTLTAGATQSSGLHPQTGSSRPTIGQGKRLEKKGKLENKVGPNLFHV